ncbi:MAG: response regulator [Candidatus Falkowbacteria bacterium]|nr:response regulator [Candidatus Falkowbacteria bacterium]
MGKTIGISTSGAPGVPELNNAILVISPYNITGITKTISRRTENNYNVIETFSGKDALEVFNTVRPDIIVVNVFMDDCPGKIHESAHIINSVRKINPAALIVTTSSKEVNEACRKKMIGLGANMYIPGEILKKAIHLIIKSYETIISWDEKYFGTDNDRESELIKSFHYLNQQYFRSYFENNPSEELITVSPRRLNNMIHTKDPREKDDYFIYLSRNNFIN